MDPGGKHRPSPETRRSCKRQPYQRLTNIFLRVWNSILSAPVLELGISFVVSITRLSKTLLAIPIRASYQHQRADLREPRSRRTGVFCDLEDTIALRWQVSADARAMIAIPTASSVDLV